MSHFFSLVRLNRAAMVRRETRDELRKLSLIGDSYRDHCLMMKLFPGLQAAWDTFDQGQRSSDFVFRQRDGRTGSDLSEGNSSSRAVSYYVVSQERPQSVPHLLTVESKDFQPVLQRGERIRFQVRANPSVTRSRNGVPSRHGGTRKPNHDVLMLAKSANEHADPQTRNQAMTDAATAWLMDRAPAWGLQVEPGNLFADGYTQHRLRRGGQPISFSSIDYTGLAEVVDPDLLQRAMLEGVGRKRGFGCGLLLVRKLT